MVLGMLNSSEIPEPEMAEQSDGASERPRLYHDRTGRCLAHDADVCEVCPGATLAARLAPAVAIGEKLRVQDNRATSHPIFVVQQRLRIYGFDPTYGDRIAWLDDEKEVKGSLALSLEAGYEKNHHEPDGYTRTAYRDEYEFVTACLTEAAADAFIEANRHNLCDPRVYAASGYRNSEWIAVRKFFLSLAETR